METEKSIDSIITIFRTSTKNYHRQTLSGWNLTEVGKIVFYVCGDKKSISPIIHIFDTRAHYYQEYTSSDFHYYISKIHQDFRYKS